MGITPFSDPRCFEQSRASEWLGFEARANCLTQSDILRLAAAEKPIWLD